MVYGIRQVVKIQLGGSRRETGRRWSIVFWIEKGVRDSNIRITMNDGER